MLALLDCFRRRFRPRGLPGLVALLTAVALTASPAVGGVSVILAAPAEEERQSLPGEDGEDEVPDAVHSSPPPPARPDSRRPAGRWADGPALPPRSARPHFATTFRPAPAEPSADGAGVRIRC